MSVVRIDLQEGFQGDLVSVRVDGREVYRNANVRTSLLTGLADSIEIPLGGDAILEVDLPGRRISGRYPLKASAPAFVGVIVEAGQIQFRFSHESFGYA